MASFYIVNGIASEDAEVDDAIIFFGGGWEAVGDAVVMQVSYIKGRLWLSISPPDSNRWEFPLLDIISILEKAKSDFILRKVQALPNDELLEVRFKGGGKEILFDGMEVATLSGSRIFLNGSRLGEFALLIPLDGFIRTILSA
ncbi:hypothetical protein [Chitinimonas koreensis]|uniref:hypothetical protein n=1 Tax=Chitinimonas koreensis TaxID=356302 RepID=UPI0012FA4133|nr:hypothetical protein [Chitinimonas koreensis]QNM95558.1 hypothetical protein H9L41_17050 [Chitinimonas koreensis]